MTDTVVFRTDPTGNLRLPRSPYLAEGEGGNMIPYEIQLIRSPKGEYLPEIIQTKKSEPETKQIKITDLKNVIPIIKSIKDHSQEQAIVISLGADRSVIAVRVVHIGNSRECSINTGDIFRGPLIDGAAGIIFAHNHPNGDLNPSKADRKTTKLLCKVGQYLSLYVLDSVIIGPSGIYSMNEKRKVRIKK